MMNFERESRLDGDWNPFVHPLTKKRGVVGSFSVR